MRELRYEVVLVRQSTCIIARLDELHVRAGGKAMPDAIMNVRERALQMLATYEYDGFPFPAPLEKKIVPIELPRPIPARGIRGRDHLRLVETAGIDRR